MARKQEQIQYVRYYAIGSAAQKVELPEKKEKHTPKPKVKKARLPVIRVDGMSAIAIAVSAVMLVCMLVGLAQVWHADTQLEQMQANVANLQVQKANLQDQYDHGYDLNEVRFAAGSMGLVPKEQVQHITVSVPEPEAEEEDELTWYESIWEDICSLFA